MDKSCVDIRFRLVSGEIKAHRHPINAISTNSSCVFTASRLVFIKTSARLLARLGRGEIKKGLKII